MLKFMEPNQRYPLRRARHSLYFSFDSEDQSINLRLDQRLKLYIPQFSRQWVSLNVFRLFTKRLARGGRRRLAENKINDILDALRQAGLDRPLAAIQRVLEQLRPAIGLRLYRKGRRNILIPYLLRPEAEYPLAARWVARAANGRTETAVARRIAGEIIELLAEGGRAQEIKKEHEKLIHENIGSFRFIRPRRRRRGRFRH
jgi:small subunit ribosomal protein S7